jgi:dTDP-4-dehydrorhamnose 3,5-epimerase
MHFQLPPFAEAKLIQCTRGAIFDVIIDLRQNSQTFVRHFAIKLTAENHKMIYIPEGFAHGFQTMEDNTEVFYQMSQFYAPDYARGVRWDDPAFGIKWPTPRGDRHIGKRDRSYPNFQAEA